MQIDDMPRFLALIAILGLTVAGCSTVPDDYNPVEWYRSAEDSLADEPVAPDDAPRVTGAPKPTEENSIYTPPAVVPGSNEPFPTLDTVPMRPETRTPAQRAQLEQGLIADRARVYSTERMPLQGTIEGQARIAPPPIVAAPLVPTRPSIGSTASRQTPTPRPAAPAATPVAQPAPVGFPTGAPPLPDAEPEAPQTPASPPSASAPPSNAPATPAQTVGPAPTDDLSGRVRTEYAASLRQSTPGRGATAPAVAAAAPDSDAGAESARRELRLATLQFAAGSTALGGREGDILRNVAAIHRQQGGVIRIVGYGSAAERRGADSERQIPKQRARVVADVLRGLGVPATAIAVAEAGVASATNARVEIYLESGPPNVTSRL